MVTVPLSIAHEAKSSQLTKNWKKLSKPESNRPWIIWPSRRRWRLRRRPWVRPEKIPDFRPRQRSLQFRPTNRWFIKNHSVKSTNSFKWFKSTDICWFGNHKYYILDPDITNRLNCYYFSSFMCFSRKNESNFDLLTLYLCKNFDNFFDVKW